jgi:hypothetical protein
MWIDMNICASKQGLSLESHKQELVPSLSLETLSYKVWCMIHKTSLNHQL